MKDLNPFLCLYIGKGNAKPPKTVPKYWCVRCILGDFINNEMRPAYKYIRSQIIRSLYSWKFEWMKGPLLLSKKKETNIMSRYLKIFFETGYLPLLSIIKRI